MSFSRSTPSPELKLALDYASLRGVILVASAGNDGKTTLALSGGLRQRHRRGLDHQRGHALVVLELRRQARHAGRARRGDHHALSRRRLSPRPRARPSARRSCPGAAALLVGLRSSATPSQVTSALSHAKRLTADLGYGRVDLYEAVRAGRAMWPSARLERRARELRRPTALDWSDAP